MRLALGTVQFGMDYGVANRGGRPDERAIADILRMARDCGIDMLDTAPSYGDSEALLGRDESAGAFRVVTKTRYYDDARMVDDADVGVAATLARSLADLGISHAYALLIHSVADATGPYADRIMDAMLEIKHRELVEKIGITVYAPDDIARFRFLAAIDLVQLPLNILDQRFRTSGALAALKRRGIEIHARSPFLQGLLLMAPDTVPDHMSVARPIVMRVQQALKTQGLTPLQGALAFMNTVPEIDYVLVGVDRAAQLREIADAATARAALDFGEFACAAAEIIDPRRWPNFHG